MSTPEPPQHLSEQARAILSMPARRLSYPALDDHAGWVDYVSSADAAILAVLPPPGDDLHSEERDLNGTRVYVQRPVAVPAGGAVYLDLHPGALIQMGGDLCRRLGGAIAMRLNMEVWSVDYRMPPSHPFPTGLDDSLTAYRILLAERGAHRVVVAGVSAGGNIAAATLLRAREEGLSMPAAAYLGTPEVDLTESGDSFRTNADLDNTLASLTAPNQLYAAGRDLAAAHLSPLFADDLSFFPPTLLSTGTRDLFLSNTVRMHRRLRQAGVDAQLHVFEAMPHIGFGAGSPEDDDLGEEVRGFIQQHLG